MPEFAYHCTNVDPEVIFQDGFVATGKGFTGRNQVEHFYKEFLPANPMFVSRLDVKAWDADAKWCMKVDISGLEKFPDFGHLLDYDAHFDESCFWWEDDNLLEDWLRSTDTIKKALASYISIRCDDGVLYAADFTGHDSFDVLGTCAIDGSMLTRDRVLDIRKASS